MPEQPKFDLRLPRSPGGELSRNWEEWKEWLRPSLVCYLVSSMVLLVCVIRAFIGFTTTTTVDLLDGSVSSDTSGSPEIWLIIGAVGLGLLAYAKYLARKGK